MGIVAPFKLIVGKNDIIFVAFTSPNKRSWENLLGVLFPKGA